MIGSFTPDVSSCFHKMGARAELRAGWENNVFGSASVERVHCVPASTNSGSALMHKDNAPVSTAGKKSEEAFSPTPVTRGKAERFPCHGSRGESRGKSRVPTDLDGFAAHGCDDVARFRRLPARHVLRARHVTWREGRLQAGHEIVRLTHHTHLFRTDV